MKKLKRISALLGVFILIAMYLCTLIFALIDSPVASDLLKASIAATIFVPVILYGLLLVTRLLKDDSKDNSDHKLNTAVSNALTESTPRATCEAVSRVFTACLLFRYSSMDKFSLSFSLLFCSIEFLLLFSQLYII